MPDLKISQLPVATTPLTGAELVPVVQGGTTDRATVADFLKSAVAGTAAAPSFAFSADLNTGLFSPTADTFAVTTGGTERLRVDSAGNVGIGTTTPSTSLEFGKAVYGATSSEDFFRIKFKNVGGIQNDVGIGQTGEENLGFNVGPAGVITFNTGTNGERMRLDASGNLGIGTTSPLTRLHTFGSNVAITVEDGTATGSTSGTASVNFRTGSGPAGSVTAGRDGTYVSGATSSSNLQFFTALSNTNNERMRLDASGNLGLGVTPSAWGNNFKAFESAGNSAFVVAGANVNGVTVSSNTYNDNTNFLYKTTGAAARYSVNTNLHQWFNAPSGTAGTAISFTQAMTLDASGNLGIGTTSPATRFDVRRDATDIFQARIINKDAAVGSTRAAIQFENDVGVAGYVGTHGSNSGASLGGLYPGALVLQGDNVNGVRVVAANASGVFSVNTGSTSSANLRLIVNSVGNLGLGTSTFGTSAATVFSIANGTEPSTGPADTVQFFSVDRSAGNTIPGIRCEGTGVTDAAITNVTVTNKIAIKVNGTVYYLLATTSAA